MKFFLFFLFFFGGLFAQEKPTTTVVLHPYRKATLSFKVKGFLQEYKGKEGASFEKGSLLAVLEDAPYREVVEKYKTMVTEAKNRVVFTQKNREHGEKLFQSSNLGALELDQRIYENLQAKAAYQKALYDCNLAQMDWQGCKLFAPFAGRIVKKIAQEHEWIDVGQELMTILDDTSLLAVMYLPSSQLARFPLGKILKITLTETGLTYEAVVEEISAEIDPRSHTFELKAKIPNPEKKIRTGMTGTLVHEE